jgi:tRNA(fMet)-specific endonuclease VapC
MFVVLDTNHFGELRENSAAAKRLAARIEARQADVFSCIVAAEESLQGWLALIRKHAAGANQLEAYARLHACLEALGKIAILPFDRGAANVFHRLQALRPRAGTMDLKIAAICITHDALLLTRNLRDFDGLPGLRIENWLD